MLRRLVWVGLLCIVLPTFLFCFSPAAVAATSTMIERYDLTGDGSWMLNVQLVDSHVSLILGDIAVYDGQSSGLSYDQTLVLDLDGDGLKEVVVAENNKGVSPHQVFYKLFGLRQGTLRLLDTRKFNWSASLQNLAVDSLGPTGDQLLGISRTDAVNGLSWIDGYWLLGMSQDRLQVHWQTAKPEHLAHLQIIGDQLLEKYGVFQAGQLYPTALRNRWLGWNGNDFAAIKEESADHYYLEESNVPQLIERVAKEQGIPVEILQAVAAQESGQKQFDYGDYLLSPDGGIGIMQVTPQHGQVAIGFLAKTYSGTDLERLKWDTYFNLQVGAQILQDKWLLSFGTSAVLPRVGSADRNSLESWYFALWAYNGYSLQNFPQEEWGEVYQEQVIDRLPGWKQAGFSQADIVSWNNGTALPAGGQVLPYTALTLATIPSFNVGESLVLTVDANLRDNPAVYPTRLGILGAGSQLSVEQRTADGWLQVIVIQDNNGLLTGRHGYVSQEYVLEDNGLATTKEQVNLRTQASAPSDELRQSVMALLLAGTTVQIASGPTFNSYDGHFWYAVKANGHEGYLALGSFQPADDPTALFCQLEAPIMGSNGWEISGASKPGAQIELLTNGQLANSTFADVDGSFHFVMPPASEQVEVQVRAVDQRGLQAVVSERQTCSVGEPVKQIFTCIGSQFYSTGSILRPFDSLTSFRAGDGVTVMAMHLFREMGASVSYDRGLITVSYGAITATLTQGEDTMSVNDQNGTRVVKLRAPIVNRNSRTFIPTRDVSENLGFTVTWAPQDDSITITTK